MKTTRQLTLAALFLALGLVLPFLTGQIPQIGSMLLPMHIPVLICGFVCGWRYGMLVGFVTPLLRSMIFGMPPMVAAVCMAFEMAAYGAVAGLLYVALKHVKGKTYLSLLGAMVSGRVVWGVVSMVVFRLVMGKTFGWEAFAAGAVINALPGIVLQLVIIPPIVIIIEKIRKSE